jgi:GT2 family glycosyltransferase
MTGLLFREAQHVSTAAPSISVVIPTRNRPAELGACLARLAPGAQSLDATAYEVIVTDDGDAAATSARLAVDFPFARVIAGPRHGPAANRNTGARAAHAPWIAFTDDDTLPSSEWLANLLAMTEGRDVVEGRTTCAAGIHSPMQSAPINETGGWWWSCNLGVRREFFLDVLGGFDERFPFAHMEDVDFRERARAAGAREIFARDAVVDHPPRRLTVGAPRAATHAAWMLYRALHGLPYSRSMLLRELVRHRGRDWARSPLSADGLAYAWGSLVEIVVVLNRWSTWQRATPRIPDLWSPAHAVARATAHATAHATARHGAA